MEWCLTERPPRKAPEPDFNPRIQPQILILLPHVGILSTSMTKDGPWEEARTDNLVTSQGDHGENDKDYDLVPIIEESAPSVEAQHPSDKYSSLI